VASNYRHTRLVRIKTARAIMRIPTATGTSPVKYAEGDGVEMLVAWGDCLKENMSKVAWTLEPARK